MSALAKFGYVDLDLEVDHEARTLVPPAMPGEEPRESDRPSVMAPPYSCVQPSSRSISCAPSESGVTAKDDRVAAMRELYERGDVEAALALGASLASLFDNGEIIPERIGVEDDDDEVSPFDGVRSLQTRIDDSFDD